MAQNNTNSRIMHNASVPTRIAPLVQHPARANSFRGDSVLLSLDEQEDRLFHVLVQVCEAYKSGSLVGVNDTNNAMTRQQITIRVAGGWVRDKLLGLYSHDIDLAVDCMTGKDFALLVQQYLQNHQMDECGKMATIPANPSQSKHLETATMKVFGIEVDFTNLRAEEVYHEHSRIPNSTMFGTPMQDALRRDFTVNALFYNLHTRQVEDYCGRGIADLRNSILKTPLDPHVTFRDDPLRVLRGIRFAVRYNLKIDEELVQAAMCPAVHKSLHIKVSRERVGKELEGMMTGKDAQPAVALDLIGKLKLAGSVFLIPTQQPLSGDILGNPYVGTHEEVSHLRELAWEESRLLLNYLGPLLQSVTFQETSTKHNLRLLHLAVFLSPFRDLTYRDHKNKIQPVLSYVVREGIKYKNKDVVNLTCLMETLPKVKDLVMSVHSNRATRLDAGIVLRSTKDLWVTSLLLVCTLIARERQQQQQRKQQQIATENVDVALLCRETHDFIVEMQLDECWNMKPLLNGKAVINELGLPKNGPIVGSYLKEQVKWMLLNPHGSREDCKMYLKSCKRRLEQASISQEEEEVKGMSDGVGPSSPLSSSKKALNQHFSKKMHVESMDLI